MYVPPAMKSPCREIPSRVMRGVGTWWEERNSVGQGGEEKGGERLLCNKVPRKYYGQTHEIRMHVANTP